MIAAPESYIDHTLLKAEADEAAIRKLCAEAREHGFFGVCVNGRWVETIARELKGSGSVPVAVVGFPLGAAHPLAKAEETRACVNAGAMEIDTVLDVGGLKSGRLQEVEADLRLTVQAAGAVPVKVILETCLLTDVEIVEACRIAVRAGARFVKTSTGFGQPAEKGRTNGATVHHVRLMRETVGPSIGVKASGGVRDWPFMRELVEAGATRIGTSSGVAILKQAKGESAGPNAEGSY
jgi:deoxyribose-phosphate aldolase